MGDFDLISGSVSSGQPRFLTGGPGARFVDTGAGERGRVEAFAERVRGLLAEPIAIGEHRVALTASVGVAVFRGDSEDPVDAGELLSQADRAMYLAKKAGRDRAHVYFGSEAAAAGDQRKA